MERRDGCIAYILNSSGQNDMWNESSNELQIWNDPPSFNIWFIFKYMLQVKIIFRLFYF